MLSSKLVLMRGALASSPFGRPLLLQASETRNGRQGDVYALVDHPIAEVSAALRNPEQWCEAMRLHIDNRACAVAGSAVAPVIILSVVRRYDRPIESAYRLAFDFQQVETDSQHLDVRLAAAAGPLGTGNYRIALEAVAADARRTFLHFVYAYDESAIAATALQAYLATFARDKIGFSVLGRQPDGSPEYVRGTRGLVERNAMRYFLAVDAQLSATDTPSRRERWYSATERYPQQLHEIDQTTYRNLKTADDAP